MTMTAVDLFAGAGGFTEGAEAAGAKVLWAGNHYGPAVETHAANHPRAQHVLQDLHQARWMDVPSMDVVLASPCCQGHTPARGKERPHHDESRSTAWAVVSCVEHHRPQAFVVENVQEFAEWDLFPAWELSMRTLGYRMTSKVLDAADFGVAQNRERVFIVGTRDFDFEIPDGTHDHVAAATVIDWEYAKWNPVRKKGRAQATIDRWEAGRKRFGERFVMPFYGSGSGKTGRSIERPIGTLPTKDRWAVVRGDEMRMLQPHEAREFMGFPATYQLPKKKATAIHLLGNAVCPPVVQSIMTSLMAEMSAATSRLAA